MYETKTNIETNIYGKTVGFLNGFLFKNKQINHNKWISMTLNSISINKNLMETFLAYVGIK